MKFSHSYLPLLVLLAACLTFFLNAQAKAAISEIHPNKTSKEEVPADMHRVTRGETIWSVAMKHNMSVGDLMEINHLADDKRLKDGQLLKIKRPLEGGKEATFKKQSHTEHESEKPHSIAKEHHIDESESAPSKNLESHVARDGETFYSISKKHHVNLDDLIAANPSVKVDRVREGLVVKIPLAPEVAKKEKSISRDGNNKEEGAKQPDVNSTSVAKTNVPSKKETESTSKLLVSEKPVVAQKKASEQKKPDTKIAATAKTNTDAKAKENGSTTKVVAASKQVIEQKVARVETTSTPVEQPKSAPPKNTEVRSYTVTEGETMESIAAKHGIGSKRLLDYNLLPPSTSLRAGDEIMIPRDEATVVRR